MPESAPFNPLQIMRNNETDNAIRAVKENAVVIAAAETPMLPQQLLLNYVTVMPEPGKETYGIHTPMRIFGPKVMIKAEDIKPGMSNIGYYTIKDNIITNVQFADVVTKIDVSDTELHIYSGDILIRNDPRKTWFVQHIWEYAPILKRDNKLTIHEAETGEIFMKYRWAIKGPSIEYFQYAEHVDTTIKLIDAYESTYSAIYKLSPKLKMPKLPDAPIPAMPGMEPEPQPVEEKPAEDAPETPIPAMPGQIQDEYIKPVVKDWWIS